MHAALARAEARLAAQQAPARTGGRRRGSRAVWRDLVDLVTGYRPEGRHRPPAC